MRADLLRQLLRVPRKPRLRERGLVERGLEVLERQREVEDVEIPTAGSERAGHEGADRAGAVEAAGCKGAAHEARRAADAADLHRSERRVHIVHLVSPLHGLAHDAMKGLSICRTVAVSAGF